VVTQENFKYVDVCINILIQQYAEILIHLTKIHIYQKPTLDYGMVTLIFFSSCLPARFYEKNISVAIP